MKINEENYVRLMKKKNERALDYFINEHGWIVKSILGKHLTQFPDTVGECMNDVFLSIWEHIDQFDEVKGEFLQWVAGISKYKALSYIRSHSKERYHVEYEESNLSAVEQTFYLFAREEEIQAFEELIGCLKKEDQDLFIKLFLEEKSQAEILEEVGISREVFYNRISRGKKRIRKAIESRC